MTKTPETTETTDAKPKRGAWVWRDNLAKTETRFTRWTVTAPAGMTADDLRDPKALGPLAARLRRWDTIEIHGNDGTWYCICRVAKATPAGVALAFKGPGLGVAEIEPEYSANDGGDPDYGLSYAGEIDKWQIVRRSDGAVMAKGFATQPAAALERDRRYRSAAA